jgi:hypothetical protein
MTCYYTITPFGVRVALRRAGRVISRRLVSLTQWFSLASSLEEAEVRLIEAPNPRF